MSIARRQFICLAASAAATPLVAGGARGQAAKHADSDGAAGARAAAIEGTARPLLARRKLFGNPSRTQAAISPDGRFLSWIAPQEGVLNIWIAPLEDLAASRCITNDRKRGIRSQSWAHDNRHILYVQDLNGDENWHVHAVDVTQGVARDLTPVGAVSARVAAVSQDRPGTLVVGINDRDPRWHDLYEVDIADGARRLLLRNDRELSGFTFDRQLGLRFAMRTQKGGSALVLRREGEDFREEFRILPEDMANTGLLGMNRAGDAYFLKSSLERDRAALFRVEWGSGQKTLLAEHANADIGGMLSDPVTGEPEAVQANYLRPEWMPLPGADEARRDLAFLAERFGSDFGVASRTLDNQRWVISASAPEQPGAYHLFDRAQRALTELFTTRPELAGAPLRPMRPLVIPARDGLELVSYLTRPAGEGPSPMVLLVHGGPWSRDRYGFNANHQWLSDRGYAVLSVNYRGSTGFGKSFVNAADHQWGRKMQDDLLDAVAWAVKEGVADPNRVAIMGGSYGGYATLAALAFTPDLFACGVAAVGPSNLETLLATIPPYWAAGLEIMTRRVGDLRTEEGRALLRERSPLHQAHAIKKPLLIGQGANDPRVKRAESDQIVAAMKANNLPVTYVLYPDEGHGWVRPENRLSWSAVVEAFLASHLGGRAEPIGTDFQDSSLKIVEGVTHVAGLAQALAAGGGN